MHPSLTTAILTWGKYSGLTLSYLKQNNPSYLQWMISAEFIPNKWQKAAARALKNEDVTDLDLPQVVLSVQQNSPQSLSVSKIKIRMADKSTAILDMPYNKQLIDLFKFEIDGRKWNAQEKHWEFPAVHIPKVISVFKNYEVELDSGATKKNKELQERRSDLDEIRVLEETDFKIPGLKLDLYGFQKAGVQFVDRVNGRCLIADEPGLGKTSQAIAFAQLHGLKTLIVCPLSVALNWKKEIEKFTGKTATIWDTKGKVGRTNSQYHIVHYDAVQKIQKDLVDLKCDLLVCDEATYLKNRNTIRAKAILGSWKERRKYPGIKTKYCLFLTGTPVMSRPVEAFTLLNFLDKERFNNFYHFVQKYGGWKGQKATNLDELHDRTKDLVIRRKKSTVYKDLPKKQRNELYVELSKSEVKEYNKLLDELLGKWREAGKPSVQHMPKIQSFLIDKKLPRVIEMIDEFIDNGRSILIFSCYLAPLHKLKELYGDKAAVITGKMKKADRQVSIDALSSGEAKVGLFSLKAASMGIDGLQHSIDTVLFLDFDWIVATHEQAEDRTHRIGQKNQVQAYYVVCANTIDEYMREILKEKQSIADQIVDGENIAYNVKQSFFKEFIFRVKTSQFFTEDEISLEDIEEPDSTPEI